MLLKTIKLVGNIIENEEKKKENKINKKNHQVKKFTIDSIHYDFCLLKMHRKIRYKYFNKTYFPQALC